MISRQVKILSLAFLFVFFGYNGVQQFLTPFFSDLGKVRIGFYILILVYSSFTISNFFIAGIVQKFGLKKSMILGSIFYSLFIFSLLAKQIFLIYIFAIFLGIAASFLWIASTGFLVRSSESESYGANSGFFHSLQSLGSTLGVLLFGLLIKFYSYKLSFFVFAFFPIFGFLIFLFLRDIPRVVSLDSSGLIKRILANRFALKLSLIWFSFTFVYGLSQGILPLEVKKLFGPSLVSLLAIFQISPIIFSYLMGRISDIKGRNPIIAFTFFVAIFSFFLLYFYPQNSIILILGIFLLSIVYATILTMRTALIGDISQEDNLEFLTSLFFVMSNLGMIASLVISSIFLEAKIIYLTSILIMVVSYLIVSPILRQPTKTIKDKISN